MQDNSFAELEEAHHAIRSNNTELARVLLRHILKENPSAQAWYLASLVAGSRERTRQFLEKALEIDPFHVEASIALDGLNPTSQTYNHSSPQKTHYIQPNSQLLQDATMIFIQRDWDVKFQTNDTVIIEKKRNPNVIASVLIIVFLSFIGVFIVIAAIALAKTEKVQLRLLPDGFVHVLAPKTNFVARHPNDLYILANSIGKGISYSAVIIIGIVIFIFWFLISS